MLLMLKLVWSSYSFVLSLLIPVARRPLLSRLRDVFFGLYRQGELQVEDFFKAIDAPGAGQNFLIGLHHVLVQVDRSQEDLAFRTSALTTYLQSWGIYCSTPISLETVIYLLWWYGFLDFTDIDTTQVKICPSLELEKFLTARNLKV